MRIKLNKAGLDELLHSPTGPVFKEVTKRSRATSNLAKRRVGVDTGRLRSSIQYSVNSYFGKVVGIVGAHVQYARYHHDGTGIYGPTGKPITPKSGQFLVFTIKGPSPGKGKRRPKTKIFTTEVEGSKANPFLTDALAEAVPYLITMATQR